MAVADITNYAVATFEAGPKAPPGSFAYVCGQSITTIVTATQTTSLIDLTKWLENRAENYALMIEVLNQDTVDPLVSFVVYGELEETGEFVDITNAFTLIGPTPVTLAANTNTILMLNQNGIPCKKIKITVGAADANPVSTLKIYFRMV